MGIIAAILLIGLVLFGALLIIVGLWFAFMAIVVAIAERIEGK